MRVVQPLLGSIIMRLSSAAVVVGTGLILAVAAWTSRHAEGQSYRPENRRMVGLVMPSREAVLGAQVTGSISEKLVAESQWVKGGDVLYRLDDRLQRISVLVANLEIDRQKMLRNEAQLQLDQAADLLKGGSLNEWEYRRRDLSLKSAEVEVKRAEQAWELEKQRLELYTVTAPFDGYVRQVVGEVGQSLRQGDAIVMVVDLDPLEAPFDLPMELYGKVSPGQEYELVPEDSPVSGPLKGRVKSVEPRIDNAGQSFRCLVEIENPQSKLPAGFKVRLVWPEGR